MLYLSGRESSFPASSLEERIFTRLAVEGPAEYVLNLNVFKMVIANRSLSVPELVARIGACRCSVTVQLRPSKGVL